MQDEEGQILEAHSISAGLDYPGDGPRARLPARHRPARATSPSPTRRRCARSAEVTRLEGIIPALETAHALHCALAGRGRRGSTSSACSGRGDKDLAEVARRRRSHDGDGTGDGARSPPPSRRSGRARRADALPDGRLPDARGVARASARPTPTAAPTSSSSACRSPTRSPTARSSMPPAPRRCARAPRRRRSWRSRARSRRALPVVLMRYANLVLARGVERFADGSPPTGSRGLIVPDLPLEEAPRCARRATPPAWRSSRWSRRRRPTSASRASARAPAASSTPSRSPAPPASARRCRHATRRSSRAPRRSATCPSRWASGSRTPEQARAGRRRRRRRRHRRKPARARRRGGRRPARGRRRARPRVRRRAGLRIGGAC